MNLYIFFHFLLLTLNHLYMHTYLNLVQVADEWQGCWARNAKVLKVLVWKVATP